MDSDSSRKAAVWPSSPLERGWKRPVNAGRDARGRALTMIGADRPHLHPGPVRINVQGAFIVEDEEQDTVTAAGDNQQQQQQHPHHLHNSAPPPLPPPPPQAHSTKDIRLPNHTAAVSHVAVDIGGSLAKVVYFTEEPYAKEPGGRLNFVKFEIDHIDACFDFLQQLKLKQEKRHGRNSGAEICVMATGGGAFKYYDVLRQKLGVEVSREDEMECLIMGLDFFITEIPNEVFTYSDADPMHFSGAARAPHIYPYLLVNIGSGVSMVKVSGPRHFARIGGTSLGGGTLWGLLSLLTGARTFDEMLAMADRGDNTAVDLLVGDIYGADYGKVGLKSSTIASSFGKVFRMKRQAEREAEDGGGMASGDRAHDAHEPRQQAAADAASPSPSASSSSSTSASSAGSEERNFFTAEDISRSLLYAISNNIGQIAYLQSEKHGLAHIYFGGSFIHGHRQTMSTLSYAIRFWSSGAKQAFFLRHEGYLGAVGAFLKRQPRNWGRRNSFESA